MSVKDGALITTSSGHIKVCSTKRQWNSPEKVAFLKQRNSRYDCTCVGEKVSRIGVERLMTFLA